MSKHNKKLLVTMLAVIMTIMMMLPSCSGGSSSGSVDNIQQNVTVGKRVFVDKSGVVYFGYENFICSALLKDGEISEFVVEGATTGKIYGMAIYNDALFISASDGLFSYPLGMFTGEDKDASPTVVCKDSFESFNHFEIFDDKVFFTYGHSLYYVPVSGGDKQELADEVYDFEVSDKGIYFVERDGEMKILSPNLDDDKDAGSIAKEVKFTVGGPNLLYRDGSKLMAYSVQKEDSEEIKTENGLNEYMVAWSNGTNYLYQDEKYKTYLVTKDGETDLGVVGNYPDKAYGYQYGDYLVSTSHQYTSMQLFDLENGTFKEYDLDKEMAQYLSKLQGGDSNPEPQTSPQSSGDYDVMKSFMRNASADGKEQYMYFNDFLLVLPNDSDIGFEGKGDSVDILCIPAKNEGYAGKLVTIRAYDMNDDSYKNLPNYHVAGVGQNVHKRFIAIYPTDLQFGPNSKAKYDELHNIVYKIQEGAADSPLQTADSSPAP